MNPNQRSSLIGVYNVYNIGNQRTYAGERADTNIHVYSSALPAFFFIKAKNMNHDQTAPTSVLNIVPL